MSESTPPMIPGQIEQPNPLEIFWENNKKLITALAVLAVLALAANYGLEYMRRQEVNARWGGFATATGLDEAYASDGRMFETLAQQPQWFGFYLSDVRGGLVNSLREDLAAASDAELEAALADGDDGSRPLVLWALANRAIANEDWAAAKGRLEELRRDFPKHFLCTESAYPVQWRPEVETDDDDESESTQAAKEPELEAPVAGSLVGRLLEQVAAEQAFRGANGRFYEAPAPDYGATATIDFGAKGKIKIGFYKSASKHAEAFLRLAEANFWNEQRVHEIERAPETPSPFGGETPGQVHFGWPSSKESDRTLWLAGEVAEENVLDWEDSGLSHFPGMVAAEPHTEGKSQIERLVLNATDAALQQDGRRVIFGRVIEGMDVLEALVDSEFTSENESRTGRGKPLENLTVQSIVVERG